MSDTPVILLHAGVCDRRMWDGVVPALHDAGRKVVTPDLRGFGSRPLGLGPFTHAGDVLSLLDALGIDSADLVGASFGGRVALQVAARAPERVSSLTLLAPALPGWEDWTDPGLIEYGEQRRRRSSAATSTPSSTSTCASGRATSTRPTASTSPTPSAGRSSSAATGPRRRSSPFDLSAVTAPTLVLVGDRDVSDFVRIGEHIAATLPSAELQMVEGAGHLLALERPDLISEVLAGGWPPGSVNGHADRVSHVPLLRGHVRPRDHARRRPGRAGPRRQATTSSRTASSARRASRSRPYHEDPDRLRTPLVKQADGSHAEATWEEAFALIAERLPAIQAEHGRDAVGVYLGNPSVHSLAGQLYGRVLHQGAAVEEHLQREHGRPVPQAGGRRRYMFGSGSPCRSPTSTAPTTCSCSAPTRRRRTAR